MLSQRQAIESGANGTNSLLR